MKISRNSVVAEVPVLAASAGLLLLGLLSLGFHDLLLQWQPAPKAAPWREPAAILSGAILVAAGAGLPTLRFRAMAAAIAASWIALWALLLHLPAVVAAHGNVAALLGLAECTAMSLGLASLAAPAKHRGVRRALLAAFGACLVVFGVSHFVYADFTAEMVPAWLPARLAIAYLTGAVHAVTGVALLAGFGTQAAATIEALMMTSFVVLLHLPRVAAAPGSRLEWTLLGVATLLTGAAWLIAGAARRR